MRLTSIFASILWVASCAMAQSDPTANNENSVATEQSKPSALPPTLHQKWSDYVVDTFGPRALFEPVFPATYWMASPPSHYPNEWRQGVPGFARNYGSELASQIAFQTARTGAGMLLHEDVRYRRATVHNPFARAGHALAYGFVDRSDSGHPQIAMANFIGSAAAGYTGRLYLPSGFNDVSHANNRIVIQFGLLEVQNVLREFSPEFGRLSERLHLKRRHLIPEWWTSTNKG
jgi:hypothetical protein